MSLYEYKHPIINKDLVSGPDSGSRKQFPTLEAWYDVVNDYEFQARCPIILKNSHRNKHFTFACHLKSCPFKVLLSYSGNHKDDGEGDSADEDEDALAHHQHHLHNNNAAGAGRDAKHDQDVHVHVKDDEDAAAAAAAAAHEPSKFNDEVSAAIAAAVAAVTDSGAAGTPTGNGASAHGDHAGPVGSVRGPFTVTKIDPYHNHPLESNLSLAKFVLTKIPRILQNDLKFDSILESLCNEDDNTVAKFRVSQYVEESGILDILKERYGLTDADLDKKLLSHIARRITTYKARFVLKKKKAGTYGMPSSPMTAAAAAAAAISANGVAVGPDGDSKKRPGSDMKDDRDDELEGRKRTRANKISTAVKMGTRTSLVNDPALAALEDSADPDDNKLPQDVAEQLRLLSSHLKEVEQQQQQQQQQQHVSDNSHVPKMEVKDDIPDENIQPELRGQ